MRGKQEGGWDNHLMCLPVSVQRWWPEAEAALMIVAATPEPLHPPTLLQTCIQPPALDHIGITRTFINQCNLMSSRKHASAIHHAVCAAV